MAARDQERSHADEAEDVDITGTTRRGVMIDLVAAGPNGTHDLRFELFERSKAVFGRLSPDRPRVPVVSIAPYGHRVERVQNRLLSNA